MDSGTKEYEILIPRFGKVPEREISHIFHSLNPDKQEELISELSGLLEEASRHDMLISLAIIELLEGFNLLPSGTTWQFKFLNYIEEAKKWDTYSRLLVDLWSKASFKLSKGTYEHLAIRKYRYSIDEKKPRQPRNDLEQRNRQIAKIIYELRKVTANIPYLPYSDPSQLDLIEQADNSGLTNFLEKFNLSDHIPFNDQKIQKRYRKCDDPNELDTKRYRTIYKRHRRTLIILDLATFALLRALSGPTQ